MILEEWLGRVAMVGSRPGEELLGEPGGGPAEIRLLP